MIDKQVRAAALMAALANAAKMYQRREYYYEQFIEELSSRSWIMSTQPS